MADVYTYDALTATVGVTVPETESIQQQVISEYKNAFGADLITTPNTPQGVLITVETLARVAVADNNVALANQINPNLAGGVFLDAILALTGSQRVPNTFSQVIGVLSGVNGTIIPVNTQAQDQAGNIWATTTQVTIAGGTATVTFQAVNPGSITIPPDSLTTPISSILGWDTVTNPAVQTITGGSVQSDQAARLYRQQTLALQGNSLAEAITSGLYASPQFGGAACTAVFYQENISDTTQVIQGVTMAPHSIYVCATDGVAPIVTTQTGTLDGTINITGLTSTANLYVGQYVSGTNIPSGTTIASIVSSTAITISQAETGSGSETVTFTSYLSTITKIANVLNSKKSGGCAYNNGASQLPQDVIITDPFSGQMLNILFDLPDMIQIKMQVTIAANSAIQNPTQTVQNAVLAYIASLNVGQSVSGFETAGFIYDQIPGIFIKDLQLGLISGSLGYTTLTMNPWQLATIMQSSITVLIS